MVDSEASSTEFTLDKHACEATILEGDRSIIQVDSTERDPKPQASGPNLGGIND